MTRQGRNRATAITLHNRQHGGSKGAGLNRECANCHPPCQGGEVLHRKGTCCKSFCGCEGFVAKSHIFSGGQPGRSKRIAQVAA